MYILEGIPGCFQLHKHYNYKKTKTKNHQNTGDQDLANYEHVFGSPSRRRNEHLSGRHGTQRGRREGGGADKATLLPLDLLAHA